MWLLVSSVTVVAPSGWLNAAAATSARKTPHTTLHIFDGTTGSHGGGIFRHRTHYGRFGAGYVEKEVWKGENVGIYIPLSIFISAMPVCSSQPRWKLHLA